jgi:hypothetical protein
MDDAVAATRRVETLDRRACRRHFQASFTATRMAADYLAVYDAVIGGTDLETIARWDTAGQVG